jgi:hypothetical protein
MKQESSKFTMKHAGKYSVPHQGSLCRVVDDCDFEPSYVIEIRIEERGEADRLKGSKFVTSYHELVFSKKDFEFASRVFAILDSESVSIVRKSTVHEFVCRRCPVFWRRDDDLKRLRLDYTCRQPNQHGMIGHRRSTSLTFEEIWESVVSCCRNRKEHRDKNDDSYSDYVGLEGFMVLSKFVALAQYYEGKRRFSARHLQQTMRHRNSPRGSEMVVIDVPPAEPPIKLTPMQLSLYERNNKTALPAPELDLDHSLLAAHDFNAANSLEGKNHCHSGYVKVTLFGSPSSFSTSNASSANGLEFMLTYCYRKPNSGSPSNEFVVRRSMIDMKWLDETFSSHKVLGGTLCGRILPPFPGISTATNKVLSTHFHNGNADESATSLLPSSLSISRTTGTALNVAVAGVGRITDIAKSFMSGYLSSTSTASKTEDVSTVKLSSKSTQSKTAQSSGQKQFLAKKKKSINCSLPESYYNPNSPSGKARQLERYLNYLLEHPALSTSFPLNTILKVCTITEAEISYDSL